MANNPDANATISGDDIGREILSFGIYDSERCFRIFDQVVSHFGYIVDVARQLVVVMEQNNKAFLRIAPFQRENFFDSLGVGGIATDSPYGIGWIKNKPPVFQRFKDRKSTRLNSSHVKISYAV